MKTLSSCLTSLLSSFCECICRDLCYRSYPLKIYKKVVRVTFRGMFSKNRKSLVYTILALFFTTCSVYAESYTPYQKTNQGGWMPMGLIRGYDSSINNSGYLPYVNSVAISPLSTITQPGSTVLPLSYGQATEYLTLDEENLKDRPEGFSDKYLEYTDYPKWHSPEWLRRYVINVAVALTKTNYSGCERNTFFGTTDGTRCGSHAEPDEHEYYRGVDCSTFTAFVYNYALGNHFSGNPTKQGGQIGVQGAYKSPNQDMDNEDLTTANTAGQLICESGMTASNNTCGQGGRYFSSFDENGNVDTYYSLHDSEHDYYINNILKPGDILFFDWGTDREIDHAAIWTGDKNPTTNRWILIQSSTYNTGTSTYPKVVEYSDYNFNNYIWGARRVILDEENTLPYLNQHFGEDNSTTGQYVTDSQNLDLSPQVAHPKYAVATNNSGDRAVAYENSDGIVIKKWDKNGNLLVSAYANSLSAEHINPDITMDDDGYIVVVWEDGSDISLTVMNPDLSCIKRNEKVNESSSGTHTNPAVSMPKADSLNRFVITWEDDSDDNGYTEIYARGYKINTSVESLFDERVINNISSGNQRNPDIDLDEYGNFVVVWEDDNDNNGYYDIYVRGFWANSNARFPGNRVNTNAQGRQFNPRVAVSEDHSDHRYVVTWEDDNDNNGYYEVLAKGYKGGTDTGSYNGNLVITFNDITVNSISAGNQTLPSIGIDKSTGEFIIAWKSDDSLYAKAFKQDGSVLIDDFEIGPGQLDSSQQAASVEIPQIDLVKIERGMVLTYRYDDLSGNVALNMDEYQLQ